jgi:hypothetical protein
MQCEQQHSDELHCRLCHIALHLAFTFVCLWLTLLVFGIEITDHRHLQAAECLYRKETSLGLIFVKD